MEKSSEREPEYQEIADELIAMMEKDQDFRKNLNKGGKWDNSIDETNAEKLKGIISKIGWPTMSKAGLEAATAAWLIAQHASFDVGFQESCLSLMKKEPEGEVRKDHLAYLTDRILVNKGLPQKYGTQFFGNFDKGEFGPRPIEDIENLDDRRASVGLGKFSDYETEMISLNENRKRVS